LKRLFVLHILPLEFFPPVTNLLNILNNDVDLSTSVFSTFNTKKRPDYRLTNIPIHRTVYPANASNFVFKILYFFASIVFPVYRMLVFRPNVILYFEPHSAFPVYIYKKFFNKKVSVFIHYHEYYPKEAFKDPAMASINFYHQLEMAFLYKKAEWISQTNSDRLDFFSKDYPNIKKRKLHVLANYPPSSWFNKNQTAVDDGIVKMFYIGAISFESTYIREVVNFVIERPKRLKLDIYSYNIHSDAKLFLESLNMSNINFFDKGLPYEEIPKTASQYNLGLVLYKPHNTNYKYNAPNKLFEYLVCGLDVWVSEKLLGCKPFLNENSKPNVLAVNFENLTDEVLDSFDSTNQTQREIRFNCQNELKQLIQEIKI